MTNLYTYKTAAKTYRIGVETLRKAVSSGLLRALNFGGGQIYLREQDIDAWLERIAKAS
jgi:excisionase family DNA binding protein